MKKLLNITKFLFFFSFFLPFLYPIGFPPCGCGPSAAEKAEKLKQDSITHSTMGHAQLDSIAALQKAQMISDSMVQSETNATMAKDTTREDSVINTVAPVEHRGLGEIISDVVYFLFRPVNDSLSGVGCIPLLMGTPFLVQDGSNCVSGMAEASSFINVTLSFILSIVGIVSIFMKFNLKRDKYIGYVSLLFLILFGILFRIFTRETPFVGYYVSVALIITEIVIIRIMSKRESDKREDLSIVK